MNQTALQDPVHSEFDQVIQDIADYVLNEDVSPSGEAMETARYCWMDTIACGLYALNYPACTKMLDAALFDHTIFC